MTITSMVQWSPDTTTFTPPITGAYYFNPSVTLLNGTITYLFVPYSDPYQGSAAVEPDTYELFTADYFGNVTFASQSGVVSTINATDPEIAPEYLNYQIAGFSGTTSQADYFVFSEALENSDHTLEYLTPYIVNTSSATVTQVAHGAGTPFANTLTDNDTAYVGTIDGNAANNVLYENESPFVSGLQGYYAIFNADGSAVDVPGSPQGDPYVTGFEFYDDKAHVFNVGEWNATNYAQFVEVWNATTNLADVQLSTISATTGVETTGWTALTEMDSITYLDWITLFNGMILQTDGTDQTGRRGFVDYFVDNSTALSGGTGGDISGTPLTIYYSGTVTQDARIEGYVNNEFFQYWVDGNGLTIQLVNASAINDTVLETYTIAQANGTANVESLGDGRLFVTYQVQTATGAVDDSTVLETFLGAVGYGFSGGSGTFAGTTEDNSFNLGSGNYTIDGGGGWNSAQFSVSSQQLSDISKNANGSWTIVIPGGTDTLSNIQVAEFTDRTISLRTPTSQDFNGRGISDILYRNNNTGDTGFDQMNAGANAGWNDVGSSSTAYSIVGTGDLTGDIGTSDILYRNATTGDTGYYLINAGINTGWQDVGDASTAYSVVGLGDFYGDGTENILFRNNATGDTGFYKMHNGANAGWVDVGASSTAYSAVGVGDFTGNGTDDILFRNNTTGDTGFYNIVNGVNAGWVDVGAGSTAYSVVGIGDFLGDGTDDILFRNSTMGDTGFYAISNGVNTGWHDVGASSTAYSVVATGDYFANGTSDILFRNNLTGDTGFYAIINGANAGWVDVGASSTAYHVIG